MSKSNATVRLIESALLIAAGTVLSLFQPLQLPFGGGITICSMLPLVLIAYRHGTKWGVFSAFVFSIVQTLLGFKTVSAFFLPGESQMVIWQAVLVCLIDYILAYTVLGFGGIVRDRFRSPSAALTAGSVIAIFLRFVMHFISGSLFFGAWAEWFFSQESLGSFGAGVLESMSGAGLAMFYSLCYNASYLVPEMIITAVAAYAIGKIPYIARRADR